MARDDIGDSCWWEGGDFWILCQGASACTSAVPIENKRLGRRSKAKYFSQEMARRRVVSNWWTQNRARWSSVIIQLVKNATMSLAKKHNFIVSSINCLQKTPKFPVANFLEARRIRFNLPKAAQNYFKRVSIHSAHLLQFAKTWETSSQTWGQCHNTGDFPQSMRKKWQLFHQQKIAISANFTCLL